MTVELNLPPHIEQALVNEAVAKGISFDEFVCELMLAHAPALPSCGEDSAVALPPSRRLEYKEGVPVLYTGDPMSAYLVEETLDMIRRERNLTALGPSG